MADVEEEEPAGGEAADADPGADDPAEIAEFTETADIAEAIEKISEISEFSEKADRERRPSRNAGDQRRFPFDAESQ